jgi:hypothetical protein
MESISLRFIGKAPLLMHNPRGVNTLDEMSKEVRSYTSKRKKTEEDVQTIARLEWEMGLYYERGIGPYIPGENVLKCLRDSGTLTRQGAAVVRATFLLDHMLPLRCATENGGSRWTQSSSVQQLWENNLKDYRRVGNQQNSVMRCRPMFPSWTLDLGLMVEPSVLSPEDLITIAERAGQMTGLGDYRPRFGRFEVEVV